MLTVEEVTPHVYKVAVGEPFHIFGSAEFSQLNQAKADNVHYLLFKDSKYRVAITGGVVKNIFASPFSAPFSGFLPLSSDLRLSYLDEATDALVRWASEKKLAGIKLTLPPSIYDESYLSKLVNVLTRKGFSIVNTDLNHHFNLGKLTPDYIDSIWHNARKNLKIAWANNLVFRQCEPESEKEAAYEIIKRNREARGFPLRMSWEQVRDTTKIVPADFFLVMDSTGASIGAAVVFTIARQIAQVIYWGDIPDYAQLKTMNFLSYKVFEYYQQQNFKIVDIGPSTENSVPNYGLCEFKESIGCEVTLKFTFSKEL